MTVRRRRAPEDCIPQDTPVRRLPNGIRYERPIRLDGATGVLLITVRDGRDPRVTIARYRVDPTPHPRLRRRRP